MTPDHITITALKSPATIGIHPWEKHHPQMLLIDITLILPQKQTPNTDNISATIDYSEVAMTIRTFCKNHTFNLLETLAEQLCTMLLNTYTCPSITLTIHKPHALPHSSNTSLSICRPQ
jgi:7,8-dihydroneopterin aldolase/epimerase/oxygenase